MKELTSMTDFVLLLPSLHEDDLTSADRTNMLMNLFIKLCLNYASFLKQKLEIWMFVPCKLVNGTWVVLEEPKYSDYEGRTDMRRNADFDKIMQEYQEAKERILFEDFEMFRGKPYNNKLQRCYSVDDWWTIEHIIYWRLELTKTAQKQIGI